MLVVLSEKVLSGCQPFYEVAIRYPARTIGAALTFSILLILANRPDDPGDPLCAEVASKIFKVFQAKITEREAAWLDALRRPRQWKTLKSTLTPTALTPLAERGLALIERAKGRSGERFSFWILCQKNSPHWNELYLPWNSPRWNECYTKAPTLFDLARLRSELDRVAYLVKTELLPGTRALHASFPEGEFKGRLDQLIEQMLRPNEFSELIGSTSRNGSYLALLLEIQENGTEEEKGALATWIEGDRRRRRPIIAYPETLIGDLAASGDKTGGQSPDPLSFNPYDLAELTVRIIEAIP